MDLDSTGSAKSNSLEIPKDQVDQVDTLPKFRSVPDVRGRAASLFSDGQSGVRSRAQSHLTDTQTDIGNTMTKGEFEKSCEVIHTMMASENEIEASRIHNNYLFGFKKWKGHVTERPLSDRSEIVRNLYADLSKAKPVRVSTVRPFNIIYAILIGWWLSLIYLLIGGLMLITILGRSYAPFCWRMAKYLIWPFGLFVHRIRPVSSGLTMGLKKPTYQNGGIASDETTVLLSKSGESSNQAGKWDYWKKPGTYVWLVLGMPLLFIIHAVIMFITWVLVISIPTAKLNFKFIRKILFLPPDQVQVGDSSVMIMMEDPDKHRSEIIAYTHQAVNVYYYKYSVDGMNVILVNLLLFVVVALAVGFADPDDNVTSGVTKCILGVLAIIPLTYYIGMGITSVSAQSSFAVGAILNATFGSGVELILYTVIMNKGRVENVECYAELVKTAITGTIIGSMLFIPGICMVVGGLKYRSQNFNPKSASITALLLFVAVGGVFAPTLFGKIYGDLQCARCEGFSASDVINGSGVPPTPNNSFGLQCTGCKQSVIGLDGDYSLYEQHVQPLVYACALLLPFAYIIGLLFALKTHPSHVYDEFYAQLELEGGSGHSHGAPAWSRLRSVLVLLASAVLIALCADLITDNIQELLDASGISQYFIGVTLIAMVPEIPEVINGIQFSLQNNVNLGIEIGTNQAIQVCLIQVPVLVLIDLIYPVNFHPLFSDVHLWAVVFSVIVINYTFQDGKSDYFQGTALVFIYVLLLCMYFVTPTPPEAKC